MNGDAASPKTSFRGVFLEIVLNVVLLMVCVLVALQVFAKAQAITEDSGAVSNLGLKGVSIVDNWRSGAGLSALVDKFGGFTADNRLTVYFDRDGQPVATAANASYIITLTVGASQSGFQPAEFTLTKADQTLIDWQVGRYLSKDSGQYIIQPSDGQNGSSGSGDSVDGVGSL